MSEQLLVEFEAFFKKAFRQIHWDEIKAPREGCVDGVPLVDVYSDGKWEFFIESSRAFEYSITVRYDKKKCFEMSYCGTTHMGAGKDNVDYHKMPTLLLSDECFPWVAASVDISNDKTKEDLKYIKSPNGNREQFHGYSGVQRGEEWLFCANYSGRITPDFLS